MLTLTDNARTVITDLTTQAGLPDSGGLRIAEPRDESAGFELALVTEAVPGDDVVGDGDATVFLSPSTSDALADLQLDADPAGGGAGFVLAPQQV